MNIAAAARLEAQGNPTRLTIDRTLVRAGGEGLAVRRLQERIGITGSPLSPHLHRLIIAGLGTQARQSTTLICRASYPVMQSLLAFLTEERCTESHCAGPRDGKAA